MTIFEKILNVPCSTIINGQPVLDSGEAFTTIQQKIIAAALTLEWEMPTPDDDLATAKSKQTTIIKNMCEVSYRSPLETSDGIWFATHNEARLDLTDIAASLPDDVTTYDGYRCADGIYRDITRVHIATAKTEGGIRKSTLFAQCKTLTDAISSELTTTVADVIAVEWGVAS